VTAKLSPRLDAITTEVVRHALIGAAEEMKATLMRCAYNPIIYEVLDFSTAVFDVRGRLAAQASGLSIFLGTLDWAVQAVVEKFGTAELASGDIFLTNDPYGGGGTHLNDVSLIMPAFKGNELVGFAASRAHWNDIGGAVPLSVQTDAKDIHAEGLVLPVVRLARAGVTNQDVLDLVAANVRDSRTQIGDMNAQIAAAVVGGRRLADLAERYGTEAMTEALRRIQDQTAAYVGRRLAALPDFDVAGEDALDDDGIGGDPARIRVRVRKRGERLLLDFAGTDGSNPSGYNVSYCGLVSACRVLFKALFDPHAPANDGSFRALAVEAPVGSCINAAPPTSVSLYGEPARRAIDAVWRALAEALPERIPAGHYGTIAGIAMNGVDDRVSPPRRATYQGPNPGGWGASETEDGESALFCITNGDTRNTPAEVIEHIAPLRVWRHSLRDGSGGRGRRTGGRGIHYDFEVLTGGPFSMTCALGRTDLEPFGAAGGEAGATNRVEVHRAGETRVLKRVTAFALERGDRVVVLTGGGGGHGSSEGAGL
jgi:N-methylhydantoinase B